MGIPLTNRGMAQSLHFVTAHAYDGNLPPHDWAALVRMGGTLAIYMGARTLGRVAQALNAAGIDPGMPAVAVANASLPNQWHLVGTLSEIADQLAEGDLDGPILVLCGRVVAWTAGAGIGTLTRAA